MKTIRFVVFSIALFQTSAIAHTSLFGGIAGNGGEGDENNRDRIEFYLSELYEFPGDCSDFTLETDSTQFAVCQELESETQFNRSDSQNTLFNECCNGKTD